VELNENTLLSEAGIADGVSLHLLLRTNSPPPDQLSSYQQAAQSPQLTPIMHLADPRLQYTPPVAIVFPGQPLPGPQRQFTPEDYNRLKLTHRMAAIVKMFAVIDAIFLIVWSIQQWPLALGIVLAVAGYYGAHTYRQPFVVLYLVYLFGSIALRIYWMTIAATYWLIFVLVLGVLIEFYIIYVVIQFMRLVRRLSAEEVSLLTLWRSMGRISDDGEIQV